MDQFPVFLSVVVVIRNNQFELTWLLDKLKAEVQRCVAEYEIILVDNCSSDNSLEQLRQLIGLGGHPNVQVFGLAKPVDPDTAAWVGLENSLGDFVAIIDPWIDDPAFIPELLKQTAEGVDIVLVENVVKPQMSLPYKVALGLFKRVAMLFTVSELSEGLVNFRLLSRRIVNFILQHPQPALTYRYLPTTSGFKRSRLTYKAEPRTEKRKLLRESLGRGVRLLFTTTRFPMRVVTSLSLLGAGTNLLYSMYVVAVGVFKDDVAEGWLSLSLQQSGMFFLISLVLLILGEYVLNAADRTHEGPVYYIGQEFNSTTMTRFDELNVRQSDDPLGTNFV